MPFAYLNGILNRFCVKTGWVRKYVATFCKGQLYQIRYKYISKNDIAFSFGGELRQEYEIISPAKPKLVAKEVQNK